MSTPQNAQTALEDISYLRGLVEENSRLFAREGAILVTCGLIWGSCSLLGWAHLTRLLPIPLSVARLLLLGSGPAVALGAALIWLLYPRLPGGPTVRTLRAVWSGLLIALAAAVLAFVAATFRLRSPTPLMLLPAVLFVLYGAAWWVAWVGTARRMHAATAAGCFALAGVTGLLSGSTTMWLVHGLGMFAFVALPGWVILRRP